MIQHTTCIEINLDFKGSNFKWSSLKEDDIIIIMFPPLKYNIIDNNKLSDTKNIPLSCFHLNCKRMIKMVIKGMTADINSHFRAG